VGADQESAWHDPRLDDVAAALLARRVVTVTGEIDGAEASEVATALLTLDATGDSRVELRLQSCRGSLGAALSLIDVIEVLGVPVHASALGSLEGGPVGVFAAATHRRIAKHCLVHLRAPDVEVAGTASHLERAVAAAVSEQRRFLHAVARFVGRPVPEVEAEWALRSTIEADDAVSLGYADEILARP
jgi:ATP-dependent Clp protease protease subunit